jgi:hypothetical protein
LAFTGRQASSTTSIQIHLAAAEDDEETAGAHIGVELGRMAADLDGVRAIRHDHRGIAGEIMALQLPEIDHLVEISGEILEARDLAGRTQVT